MKEGFKKPLRRAWLPAVALGLAMLSGRAATAEIHSDFDPGGSYFGGIEGWFDYDGNLGFATATPAGGSTQWLGVKPNQYWGKITSQSWATPDITVADWNAATHLKFDIMVDNLWFPDNTTQQVSVEFQTHTGGSGAVNQIVTPTIDTSLKNVVQHVSIPLSGLQPFSQPDWNLSINLYPAYAWEWDLNNPEVQPYNPRYYVDNIRWVPEPSSMLLLGLGVAVSAVMRRMRTA